MELQKFISDILAGRARVLSFDNVTFGADKDITTSVLAALNFARLAFAAEGSTPLLSQILALLYSKKMVDDALGISREWPSGIHLEVEDVYRIPLFEASLKLVSTDYDSPRPDHIARLLDNLRTLDSSAAILITRYPDVITCLRLRAPTQDVFVLFSPRVNSEDEQVASLTFSTSLPHITQKLCGVFPLKKIHVAPAKFDWQGKLLEKCTGHVFAPRATSHDARIGEEALIVSSLTLLSLRGELEELTRNNGSLKRDKQRLEKSVVDLEVQLEEEQTKAKRAESSVVNTTRGSSVGSGRGPQLTQASRPTREREFSLDGRSVVDPKSQLEKGKTKVKSVQSSSKPSVIDTTRGPSAGLGRGPQSAQPSRSARKHEFFLDAKDEIDPNMQFALQLQASFDSENDKLLKQKHELMQTAQRQYHCGVCLDDFPEDDAVHIDACGHEICRDCARGHISSKIEEHRFPVLCPVCMADQKNQDPGTIPGALVQLLGVSEKQWATWQEMEIAQFSIPFNCRKCQLSGFVDRLDLEAQSEIHCPFPSCDHVWCKKCQQTIESGGPEHSCDGTSELDHLVKQQGWRYCPNCKTPIQKTHGCNHLSCIAPGCNTHFCYRCGETINRTAIPREIQEGKTAHFRSCTLF